MGRRKHGWWHDGEALTLLEETEYLVGELLKGGIPFPEREEYYRKIARAREARDWGAYEDALSAYSGGARRALQKARREARDGFFL